MSENSNFIFNEIDKDLANGVYKADEIMTRFPPEPNGYLHIGHAKAIFINFSVKEKYHGRTNLRFDDTNPAKEDVEYTEAIERDLIVRVLAEVNFNKLLAAKKLGIPRSTLYYKMKSLQLTVEESTKMTKN